MRLTFLQFITLSLAISCVSPTFIAKEQVAKTQMEQIPELKEFTGDILAMCNVQAQDADKEILKAKMQCVPFSKSGSIILIINYEVFITGQLEISTTLLQSTSTLTFDVTATPSFILSQAKKDVAKRAGQVTSKFVSLDERIPVSKMENTWQGILCTIQPIHQLKNTLGSEHIVTEFWPPLPGVISPIADKQVYEKEIPRILKWEKIEATIISSTNSTFVAGEKIYGNVTVSPISPILEYIHDKQKITITADKAFEIQIDFGGYDKTTALGLEYTTRYYIDTKSKKFNAITSVDNEQQQVVFIDPK